MRNIALSIFLFFMVVAVRASDIEIFFDEPNSDQEESTLIPMPHTQRDQEHFEMDSAPICTTSRSAILDKFLNGGNLITAGLWGVGKGYWVISYIAQAGCTLATSDMFNKIIASSSSLLWKDCQIFSPCDPELSSSALCKLDQMGDIAGYVNLGFIVVSCGLIGYRVYKSYKSYNEKTESEFNRIFLQ